ncbi:MAG: 6-phosphogluconolactonase, partial [Limisphaerales bacterium]
MEIIIQSDAEAATAVATFIVARLLREKPNAVLGLATGSTPLLLYRALARMKLDWRRVTTFNLDEYVGLPTTHEQSYHHFMWKNLFRHVNISKRNVHIPDGMSRDIPKFCADYEARIRAAGG